ncbi:hypothetical protein J3E69DRAFT_345909 [Trichoderma sp. SZMC 28015]
MMLRTMDICLMIPACLTSQIIRALVMILKQTTMQTETETMICTTIGTMTSATKTTMARATTWRVTMERKLPAPRLNLANLCISTLVLKPAKRESFYYTILLQTLRVALKI